MLFAHDTARALHAAATLVNTGQNGFDVLADIAALDRWLGEEGWTGARRGDQRELDEVRALRRRLRRLWALDEAGVAAEVNEMLRAANALPQLVAHDGWPFHLHATPQGAPLVDRMAVEAAMALVDVVRQGELSRLQVCRATDCADVLVDLSKNRSRLYCSTSCTNRMNVAAYRSRRAGTPAEPRPSPDAPPPAAPRGAPAGGGRNARCAIRQ